MPRQRQKRKFKGPLVGTLKGAIAMHVGREITFSYKGENFDLDKAPKDANGTVELLEVKDDVVWTTGIPYFDPATRTYLPSIEKKPPKCETESSKSDESSHDDGKEDVPDEVDSTKRRRTAAIGAVCVTTSEDPLPSIPKEVFENASAIGAVYVHPKSSTPIMIDSVDTVEEDSIVIMM